MDDLERERANLGTAYSDADAIWSLMNSLATRFIGQSDHQRLASLYRYMGTFSLDEGRDSFGVFQDSSRERLRAATLEGSTHAEVSAIRDMSACEACVALDGARFTIEDALKRLPIPHRNCSSGYGFCRCMWRFSIPPF